MNSSYDLRFSQILLAFYVFSVIAFSFNSTYFFVSNLLGAALLVTYIIEAFLQKYFVLNVFRIEHYVFLVFILLCCGGLLFSPEGYLRVRTIFQLLLLSIVISNLVGLNGKIWPAIIGTFSGLLYATQNAISQNISFFEYQENTRIASTLENANTYATALILGVVFCIYNIINADRVKKLKKTYYIINSLLFILFSYQIIAFTGSRKGVILLFVAIIMTNIYFYKNLRPFKRLFFILSVPFQAFIVFVFIKNSPHYERIESLFKFGLGQSIQEGSLNVRASMVEEAIRLWSKKPLFGWGIDQFRLITSYGTYSHNNITELLVGSGILGLILFYSIYFTVLVSSLKLIRSKNNQLFRIGWWMLTVLMVLFFGDLTVVSYYSKFNWIVLSLVFGLIHFHTGNEVPFYKRIHHLRFQSLTENIF